ncbi:hypothetical protein Zmor_008826 [Zophobas morio]|uniref:60S ribosomal protein L32 n=1 Tax=Zophobas morio TaxID=2755281 RepID=A0AA38LZK3_9CUCU|nr:hypothetical protein Zmor_008826 [Zophobas morio]
MTGPKPIKTIKIVKKRTKKFRRHQSDLFKRLSSSWRRPRGIDSRVRRKFKGTTRLPKIGYGSNTKTKFMSKDGFRRINVRNVADLELLMMHNRKYSAEICHNVSAKKRALIVERANQLNIKVVNRNAKLRTEELE